MTISCFVKNPSVATAWECVGRSLGFKLCSVFKTTYLLLSFFQNRPRGVGGIVGIERKLEEKSKETDNHIQKVSIINKGLFWKGLLHSRFSPDIFFYSIVKHKEKEMLHQNSPRLYSVYSFYWSTSAIGFKIKLAWTAKVRGTKRDKTVLVNEGLMQLCVNLVWVKKILFC